MKRTCGMLLRFTREEIDALTKKARKANMSRENYCRTILNGSDVNPAPDVDTATILRDVQRAGYNLNQVVMRGHSQGFFDMPELRKALNENIAASEKIIAAYTLPKR